MHNSTLQRRSAIKMIASSGVAFATPFVLTPSRTAPKRIVIGDRGGIFSQILDDVFYKPFAQKHGIEVISATTAAIPTPEIRTMVESRNYAWDMAVINQLYVRLLTVGKAYLEPHGLEHDPVISAIEPQFMSPYGVGKSVYSTVLAYRRDTFKGRHPESWQDFWDVEQFPGRRALRKLPNETIEIALMAAGIPADNVYPCALDQAFKSLGKIKPSVAVWWTSGPQTETLLRSSEVDLLPVWTPVAKSLIDANMPVGFSWEQHLYAYDNWAILKGTPNADLCRQFIQFASEPKRQAHFAQESWYGPTHSDTFKYIAPKQLKLIPTYPDNLRKGLHIDASYWSKHQEATIERFNHWLLS
ncbi:ABC transporter substrate-binding protein [Mycoavidus sp. HKI]|uniref:ABC transporter substrate-binding protein n=1 Tax=Mycoavidus sp. HKI TaxID=2840467 RepID=UPI001CBC9270|nr:ABC transporter substrate-binding protein [Mycoavidus sp. HKI]UAW64959.2 ABC transporter substrate-binding protein [Mycoavidus sp. HKI]